MLKPPVSVSPPSASHVERRQADPNWCLLICPARDPLSGPSITPIPSTARSPRSSSRLWRVHTRAQPCSRSPLRTVLTKGRVIHRPTKLDLPYRNAARRHERREPGDPHFPPGASEIELLFRVGIVCPLNPSLSAPALLAGTGTCSLAGHSHSRERFDAAPDHDWLQPAVRCGPKWR